MKWVDESYNIEFKHDQHEFKFFDKEYNGAVSVSDKQHIWIHFQMFEGEWRMSI